MQHYVKTWITLITIRMTNSLRAVAAKVSVIIFLSILFLSTVTLSLYILHVYTLVPASDAHCLGLLTLLMMFAYTYRLYVHM